MRTVQLSITVGGYSDGTWHLSIIKSTYDRGRLEGCRVVAQRVATESMVLDHLAVAAQHAMDVEHARMELTERTRRAHSPDAP